MVAAGGFALAYQPVVSLKDGRLHHFEALARFAPGASPDLTIRFAEELDLIRELDLAVTAAVVDALARSPADIRIAVNVSALSLMTPGFVDAFEAVAAPVAPERMMVEVTETQDLGDLDRAAAIITHLRRDGRSVCLDDFGAGAATLEYLRRLDVDFVKIDGRYVRDAGAVPRDAVILKHMVALCRELGVATIAEMVETAETAALLSSLGVDLVQGFAYSRPLPEPRWEQDPPKAS
jgi:EAL domain-containing protein (putative c-di-GMP-specific phosphodiesterase class I)